VFRFVPKWIRSLSIGLSLDLYNVLFQLIQNVVDGTWLEFGFQESMLRLEHNILSFHLFTSSEEHSLREQFSSVFGIHVGD
jgi:hypothetical protein